MKKVLVFILTISLAASSCGEDAATDTLDTAWSLFGAGDFAAAHIAFTLAAVDQPAAAYAGLGWTTLRMNKDSLSAADQWFAKSTLTDPLLTDAFAGWSIVAWANNDHTSCISRAQTVLTQDSQWQLFSTTINIDDIKYHKAFSHFRLGQYSECISLLQQLDPSWTAPSVNDANVDELLLDELEWLYDDLI